MQPTLKAATVQFQHHPGDILANLAILRSFVEHAATQGVELVAFPEMCLTGYWHIRKLGREQVEALSEPVPGGKCCAELMALSAKHNITIGAGLIERAEDGQLYNSYFVAMPDGRWARHRKIHLFISNIVYSKYNIPLLFISCGQKSKTVFSIRSVEPNFYFIRFEIA